MALWPDSSAGKVKLAHRLRSSPEPSTSTSRCRQTHPSISSFLHTRLYIGYTAYGRSIEDGNVRQFCPSGMRFSSWFLFSSASSILPSLSPCLAMLIRQYSTIIFSLFTVLTLVLSLVRYRGMRQRYREPSSCSLIHTKAGFGFSGRTLVSYKRSIWLPLPLTSTSRLA